MTRRGVVSAILPLLLVAGCVTPARTTDVYEAKATLTAQDALSHLRTALLAVQTFADGKLFNRYLEPVLVGSENGFGSVQNTFDSVQPPDTKAADSLQETLDPLLEKGSSGLADLRIEARRGETAKLLDTAKSLRTVADQLESFGQEHAQ